MGVSVSNHAIVVILLIIIRGVDADVDLAYLPWRWIILGVIAGLALVVAIIVGIVIGICHLIENCNCNGCCTSSRIGII